VNGGEVISGRKQMEETGPYQRQFHMPILWKQGRSKTSNFSMPPYYMEMSWRE